MRVDPQASQPQVGPAATAAGVPHAVAVRLRPADRFGNLWGPGRPSAVSCTPKEACRADPKTVIDHGDGSYTVPLAVAPGLGSARLDAFGAEFVLDLPCDGCPQLAGLKLAARRAAEHAKTSGVVRLAAAAPATGAVVYLRSSNRDAAWVPESVTVPAGKTEAEFPIHLLHAHDGPAPVTITATYGAGGESAGLTVTPLPPPPRVEPGPRKRYPGHSSHGGHGDHRDR